MLQQERLDGGGGIGDTAGADVHVDIGGDTQGIRTLHVLGHLGDLLLHTVHVVQDLIGGLLQPGGLARLGASADSVEWDALPLGQNAHQARLLITTPGNLVGQVVNGVPGRFSLADIQGLTGQAGGPHLLSGVAVAVTDGLHQRSRGLALHIGAGQVGAVIVDDLGKAALVVGVVGDGLSAGVSLGADGEQVQGCEFGVLDIVRLSLDVIQLTGEEHRGVLGAVEAGAGGRHDSRRNGGVLQRPHFGAVIVSVLFHLSASSFSPYAPAPVLSAPGFHLLSASLYFRTCPSVAGVLRSTSLRSPSLVAPAAEPPEALPPTTG